MSEFTRPEHHVHDSSDPLPGAKRGGDAVDYSAGTMERQPSSAFDESNIDNQTSSNANPSSNFERSAGPGGENAFNSERPLDVQPVSEGELEFYNDLSISC